MDFCAVNIERFLPAVSSLSIGLSLSFISSLGFSGQAANSQEFTPQTILSHVVAGPKWYQAITMPASATTFTYTAPASNAANAIQAVDITYFGSGDSTCSTPPWKWDANHFGWLIYA